MANTRRSPQATRTLILAVLGTVALVALATTVAIRGSARDEASSNSSVHGQLALGEKALGAPAPLFVLPRLQGAGEIQLEDYLGDIVVLNFWRSDCTPCRNEFGLLRRTHGKTDVKIVGVSTDSIPSDARRSVVEERARWPQALDRGLLVAKAYGIDPLPQTIFIGRDGGVAFRVYGELRPSLVTRGIKAAEAQTAR